MITATPRQLESLVRISEALARMRLSDTVAPSDVEEAIRLMKVCFPQAVQCTRKPTDQHVCEHEHRACVGWFELFPACGYSWGFAKQTSGAALLNLS